MRSTFPPESSNYLLFSDVHLGADLVQHAQPWTAERLREVHQVDHELGTMLDHYLDRAEPDRPWRVVIAGDPKQMPPTNFFRAAGFTTAKAADDDEDGSDEAAI